MRFDGNCVMRSLSPNRPVIADQSKPRYRPSGRRLIPCSWTNAKHHAPWHPARATSCAWFAKFSAPPYAFISGMERSSPQVPPRPARYEKQSGTPSGTNSSVACVISLVGVRMPKVPYTTFCPGLCPHCLWLNEADLRQTDSWTAAPWLCHHHVFAGGLTSMKKPLDATTGT